MRDGDALHRRSQWSRHRATLGYVPQECRWTQSWRVGEFVEFCAAMYRVPRAEITARSEKALAAVVDAGACPHEPTTVVDLTPIDQGDEPVVIREGRGSLAALGL